MAKTEVIRKERKARTKPPITQEDRENQMIALAYDVAEERMRNGTASSQEIVTFLRAGLQRERHETEILIYKQELLKAQTKMIEDAEDIKKLYSDAMTAFSSYKSGSEATGDEIVL